MHPYMYLSSQVDALCEGSRAECHVPMHSYMHTHSYFELDALCQWSRVSGEEIMLEDFILLQCQKCMSPISPDM